jgi:GNAT superfamily N-acetyltransferase
MSICGNPFEWATAVGGVGYSPPHQSGPAVLTSPLAVTIRPLAHHDSIEALTALLHRSYAALGTMGLNYTAVDQTPEVTRRRNAGGRCLVAVDAADRVIGTVLFYPPERTSGSPWFNRPEVAKCAQFGVDLPFQKQGIGSRLADAVEAEARATRAKEIALDTAEPATHLIEWYGRRGYRFIEYAQWRGKRYRSVILSKSLEVT